MKETGITEASGKVMTLLAQMEEQRICKQLGQLISKHPECKRFLADRFTLEVHRITPEVSADFLKGIHILHITSKFRLHYNSPSLFKRLRFFVFDIVTWLKGRTHT